MEYIKGNIPSLKYEDHKPVLFMGNDIILKTLNNHYKITLYEVLVYFSYFIFCFKFHNT